jgi:hypothetical protein
MFDVMADLGNINVAGIANNGSSTYFTLPSSDGTSGQALTTDASGQFKSLMRPYATQRKSYCFCNRFLI